MDERSSKEKILAKVRRALLQKGESVMNSRLDLDTDIFVSEEGEAAEIFGGNFIANKGNFHYCFNVYHFREQLLSLKEKNNWQNIVCLESEIIKIMADCGLELNSQAKDVLKADAGLTGCAALVSRIGSIIVTSKNNFSRTTSIYPPVHLVIAWQDQIVYDLKDYFQNLQQVPLTEQPSMISITSGPSRTADIEKTLVLGAHGPKEIHVFYIDQKKKS